MAVPWWRSTDRVGTPCQARNVAAESPTRLPPTIRTSVFIITPVPVSGQSRHFLAYRERFGKPAFPFSDHALNTRATLKGRPRSCGEVAEWLNAPHSKCGIRATVSGVRIPPSPPFQYRTANAGRSRIYAGRRRESAEQVALQPHDASLAFQAAS